jgi:hypothetical protein
MSEPIKKLLQAPEVMPEQVWPEPLPLFRDLETPEPFPLEALGKLEGVARETLRIVKAPDAMIGASFLAAASLATQGLANVVMDGRVHPLSLYLLTIGVSGERKTTVDGIATAPLRERQKRLYIAQEEAIAIWEGQVAVWEGERKRILGDKKQSREAREEAIERLGPPPPKPWGGVFLTSEPTFEGLVKLLADGWPLAGLFAHEAGSFLGGYAMDKDHRLRTVAGLSELWDGRPVDRTRSGDGMSLLYNRRTAIHLLATPLVARNLLADGLAKDQGILSRFLSGEPLSTIGSRLYEEEAVEDTPAYQIYAALLENAWEKVEQSLLNDPESRRQGLVLRNIPLAPEAKGLWVRFYNHIETNLKGDLEPITGFAAKLPDYTLRLAGVLTLFANPEAGYIGKEYVESAIALAQFYGNEALRLVGGYRIPRTLARAQEVLTWIITRTQGRNPRLVYLAEVYQAGPSEVRSAKAAREVLRLLEEHNYLAHRQNVEVGGVTRRDAWEVNPRAISQV